MDLSFVQKLDVSEVESAWVRYRPEQAEEALRDMAVADDMLFALLSYCGENIQMSSVEFRTLLRSASFAKNAVRELADEEMDSVEFFKALGGPKLGLSKEESDVLFEECRPATTASRQTSPPHFWVV